MDREQRRTCLGDCSSRVPSAYRTRSVAREEKSLTAFMDAAEDKWVETSYEVSFVLLSLR